VFAEAVLLVFVVKLVVGEVVLSGVFLLVVDVLT
jgi:hypothetical protein